MSLRTRILLLVMAATLAPALIFGAYQFTQRDDEVEDAKRDLSLLAKYAAENLDDKVKGTVQLLHGLSRAPDLDTADKAACSGFLAGVLERYPQYTGLLTAMPDGELYCDSLRSGRRLNLSERGYFRQVRATGEPAFEVVFGGLTGIAVLQVAYPVMDDRGRFKYLLLASLNLSQYARGFAAASRYPGFRILIWNGMAILMVREPDFGGSAKLTGKAFPASELFRFAASAQAGSAAELPDLDAVRRVWALGVLPEPRGGGARITIGVPHEALVAQADKELRYALGIVGGISLLAFLCAWFVAEIGIRRQVMRIADAATRVGSGELGARIGPPYPPGELGELMAVVDRMAGAVQVQRAEIESRSRDLGRANRTLRVLSGINSAIVRIRDRDELFKEACRIAVEDGGFRMAWLGVVDREAMRIKPVAWHGIGLDYIERMPVALGDLQSARRGLAVAAVLERTAMISNDMTQDPRITPGEEPGEHPFRSLALLPLLVGEEAAGVLALYAAEVGFFDKQEMKLLNELAGDIAFALEHIGKSEKLVYLTYFDPLTGLANSTLFHERLEQEVVKARATQRKIAVFILDIERFKTINDTLGRAAGDELLRQVAERLVSPTHQAYRFARVGADRFAVFVPDARSENDVTRLAEQRIEQSFSTPFRIGDTELRVSIKFGAALYPDHAKNSATLFRNAEAALKKAKSSGDRYLLYNRRMTEHVAENLALENQLRQAIDKDEFVLHYQPKVSLETREIVGVEALIRWQSPALGLVPPIRFIPLLEETGLILEVGTWAIQRAARDHRGWVEQQLKAPRVAVNISPIQLRQQDFVAVIARALKNGVTPTGIDLEITESLLMEDVQGNIAKLKEIRRLGIDVAIDDFGTGYSSLAYLAKLPVQSLKIDRAFIVSMLSETDSMTLVSTMISLTHSLRLKVVAEGVETEEQAKMLRLLRCDQMQGFLFSKPLPLEQMTSLLVRADHPVPAVASNL